MNEKSDYLLIAISDVDDYLLAAPKIKNCRLSRETFAFTYMLLKRKLYGTICSQIRNWASEINEIFSFYLMLTVIIALSI